VRRGQQATGKRQKLIANAKEANGMAIDQRGYCKAKAKVQIKTSTGNYLY
jgi:hypothetical protein